ncbi:MAG: hypothetical protein BMS9Abin12_1868 [Acidimicrobiia bacterium]|nr:MAG: hypothetical protein BMS9Abin12_1868 [Acidimicrobiia bacterium]
MGAMVARSSSLTGRAYAMYYTIPPSQTSSEDGLLVPALRQASRADRTCRKSGGLFDSDASLAVVDAFQLENQGGMIDPAVALVCHGLEHAGDLLGEWKI